MALLFFSCDLGVVLGGVPFRCVGVECCKYLLRLSWDLEPAKGLVWVCSVAVCCVLESRLCVLNSACVQTSIFGEHGNLLLRGSLRLAVNQK